MTNFDYYKEILRALHKFDVEYILVGGVAINYHGINRFTKDLDIFVKQDSDNLARLRQALHTVFDDESIDEITLEEDADYPVIRYGTPAGFYIDILFRLGEVFTYENLEWEELEDNGIKIRIARPETLISMKRDTVRLHDKADAYSLQRLLEKRRKSK